MTPEQRAAFDAAFDSTKLVGEPPKMDEPTIWADGRWWTPREFVEKYGTKK